MKNFIVSDAETDEIRKQELYIFLRRGYYKIFGSKKNKLITDILILHPSKAIVVTIPKAASRSIIRMFEERCQSAADMEQYAGTLETAVTAYPGYRVIAFVSPSYSRRGWSGSDGCGLSD